MARRPATSASEPATVPTGLNDPPPGVPEGGAVSSVPLVVVAGVIGTQGWTAGRVLGPADVAQLAPERLEQLLALGALRPYQQRLC